MRAGGNINICELCHGSGALMVGAAKEFWGCPKCGGEGVNATGLTPKFIGKRR
jgi:hypothetical protein